VPTTTITDAASKALYAFNVMENNAILRDLLNTEFFKVTQCKLSKYLWDKLECFCEGDDKIKEANVKTYRHWLIYLPSVFNPKVSSIKELSDIQNFNMGTLHVTLTTYELKIEKEKKVYKEVAFKVAKE